MDAGEDLALFACDVDTLKELHVNVVLSGGSAGAHDTSFHNTMMRNIDIRKDVYAHVVLSGGTTLSLLYAFHLDDPVNES